MKPLFQISYIFTKTDGCTLECFLVMAPVSCSGSWCRCWPQMWITKSGFLANDPPPPKVQVSTPHRELIPWERQMAFPPRSHHIHKLRHPSGACRGYLSSFSQSSSPLPERLKNDCKYLLIVQWSHMVIRKIRDVTLLKKAKQATNGKQKVKDVIVNWTVQQCNILCFMLIYV